MTKKKILSIIMLVVLVAGIVCAVYGSTGTAIYNNAAEMLGGDKKTAMVYIQEPSKLEELGNIGKVGADKVKDFLKSLGADAAAVDVLEVAEKGLLDRAVLRCEHHVDIAVEAADREETQDLLAFL